MQRLYILFLVIVISSITTILIIYSEKKYKDSLLDKGIKLLNSIPKDFKIEDEKFLSIPKYYINLDRSKDRREKMETQFKKYGIDNYTRIRGFDKQNIKNINEGVINGIKYVNQYKLEDYQLGCTLSHLKAIKTSYDNGDDCSIIFEDDITLELYPVWKKSFMEMLKILPEDFEIFQMISGFKTKNNDFSFDIITRPKTSSYGCAASYLINRKGMEKIINNFFLDKNYIAFEKKLNLENPIIDFGIFNFMNVYTIKCNLFLLYNFSKEKNVSGFSNTDKLIEKDYETLKYLTDNK